MKEVFKIVRGEEDKIKKDDLLSRQSLNFRDIEGDYYLIVDGSEESIKKLKSDFGLKVAKERDRILKKFEEEEDKARDGFGRIFG